MKYRIIFLILLAAGMANGQDYFTHAVTRTKTSPSQPVPARDFWFSIPKNYDDQGGKYIELFVTSAKQTTAHIEVSGSLPHEVQLTPYKIGTFFIPLGWEMTTSGIVQQKAIHVWSDDADLTVYYLNRNPATSDGSPIMPITGCGTEYVVASYESLYEGTDYDYPSEFTLAASHDSTVCTITPTVDIRNDTLPTTSLYKGGVPFVEVLNRGDAIQYEAIKADNADTYDLTGTVVKSNYPISVIGASQCPNIPPDWLYCDHICEMVPPISIWGKNYCTIPFVNRRGGDSYLVIASKDGQTIYRNGAVYAILNKYEKYFRPDISVQSHWSSDAPFLLMQYINSTTWQDENGQDNAGIGDPSMVMITPIEQYTNSLIFNTPLITTGTGFQNYYNIIIDTLAVKTTTIDSIPIKSYPNITAMGQIPYSRFMGFLIRGVGAKGHILRSTSGVTAYGYGYGSYDSYAWGSVGSMSGTNSADTTAPFAKITDHCFCANVSVSDKVGFSEKLLAVAPDSLVNMTFVLASDPYGKDSVVYSLCVKDSSQPAFGSVSSYDLAMNKVSVASVYDPSYLTAAPQSLGLGTAVPGKELTGYITLTSTGADSIDVLSISFLWGNKGFRIDSMGRTTLAPGDSERIKIIFKKDTAGSSSDYLYFQTSCQNGSVLVYAGTAPPKVDVITSITDTCIAVGDTLSQKIIFSNKGVYSVIIDSVTIIPADEFVLSNLPAFPDTVKGTSTTDFASLFIPKSTGNKNASVKIFYHVESIYFDSLSSTITGCALASGVNDNIITEVSENSNVYREAKDRLDRAGDAFFVQSVYPNPAEKQISIVYATSEPMLVTLDIYDMLGKPVRRQVSVSIYQKGIYQISCNISGTPGGTYIYRLQGGAIVISGRLLIKH
jgi:hypothetical protein